MKFFRRRKDGGRESTVTGYWLVEIKSLFSIVLLRFDGASREAFHTHSFNCFSWVVSGGLRETLIDGRTRFYSPSWFPFITRRTDFHMVDSLTSTTWVLSFRGPWRKRWQEYLPKTDEFVTLTNGRREVARAAAGLTA